MHSFSRYLSGSPSLLNRRPGRALDNKRMASRILQGQLVEVRPAADIMATLDADLTLDGLPFMPEMLKFCGRRMTVYRRANRTCVEGRGLRAMRNAVLLADSYCDGAAHDGCQRQCLNFWKEAWLKPVADLEKPPAHPDSSNDFYRVLAANAVRGTQYVCQSTRLHAATQHLSKFNVFKYLQEMADGELSPGKFLRIVGRVLANRLRALDGLAPIDAVRGPAGPHPKGDLDLQAGECVEVRAIEEISRTVGPAGRNRGLLFEPDMTAYVGQRFEVEHRVQKIISEETGKMVHLTHTVALKNVRCAGVCAKNCPRAQAHFWREAWLKRAAPADRPEAAGAGGMSRPARLVGAGPDAKQPLRVLHVMRAPVGGLFRHVLDLSRAQIADGHSVGVIADSLTGGARAELELARLAEDLPLGLLRIPIHRNPHWSDLGNLRRVSGRIDELKPDVVHGHGSKGGFLARAAGRLAKTVHPVLAYTPHGGAIHFARMSLEGIAYRAIERALAPCTDVYLFESQFAAERLRAFAGASRAAGRVVVNGLHESELLPVAPAPDAADFLFIGELRALKGVCTLIEAMQVLQQRLESPPRLVMVGDGALDRELSAEIARRGLSHCISLLGCKPARKAFSLGRILVVPSHAESLPYVVLEAAGARVPIISTNVGGIPEIFGPYAGGLIRPGDVGDLANAMQAAMVAGAEALADDAERLAAFVGRKFLVTNMYDQVISGYRAGRIARESREQFKPERSESASPY